MRAQARARARQGGHCIVCQTANAVLRQSSVDSENFGFSMVFSSEPPRKCTDKGTQRESNSGSAGGAPRLLARRQSPIRGTPRPIDAMMPCADPLRHALACSGLRGGIPSALSEVPMANARCGVSSVRPTSTRSPSHPRPMARSPSPPTSRAPTQRSVVRKAAKSCPLGGTI